MISQTNHHPLWSGNNFSYNDNTLVSVSDFIIFYFVLQLIESRENVTNRDDLKYIIKSDF
jgi:hypothetical protein